jgi:hypothetical protein
MLSFFTDDGYEDSSLTDSFFLVNDKLQPNERSSRETHDEESDKTLLKPCAYFTQCTKDAYSQVLTDYPRKCGMHYTSKEILHVVTHPKR